MSYIENIERAISRLALLAESDGRFADAEAYVLEAIEINQRRIATQDEVHYAENSRNCLLGDLARIKHGAGDFEKSDAYFRQAFEGATRLAENYPQTDIYVLLPYLLRIERCRALESRGNLEDAESLRKSTIGQLRELIDARPNLLEAKNLLESL